MRLNQNPWMNEIEEEEMYYLSGRLWNQINKSRRKTKRTQRKQTDD